MDRDATCLAAIKEQPILGVPWYLMGKCIYYEHHNTGQSLISDATFDTVERTIDQLWWDVDLCNGRPPAYHHHAWLLADDFGDFVNPVGWFWDAGLSHLEWLPRNAKTRNMVALARGRIESAALRLVMGDA